MGRQADRSAINICIWMSVCVVCLLPIQREDPPAGLPVAYNADPTGPLEAFENAGVQPTAGLSKTPKQNMPGPGIDQVDME